MLPTPADTQVTTYPEKFLLQTSKASAGLIKSVVGLLLFIIAGYFLFRNLSIVVLVVAILLLHEMGHFIAMRIFQYTDTAVFFVPMVGAYVTGRKREISQQQSVIILLAGPMPGIVIGAVLYLIWRQNPAATLLGVQLYSVSLLMMFLNIFNLLPIYPLDGGQILNRVFIDEESVYSRIFKLLSAGIIVFIAIKLRVYPVIVVVVYVLIRHLSEKRVSKYEELAGENGFDLNKDYEELSDEEYWQIRDLMIAANPEFKQFKAGEPYEYNKQEEKMALFIQNLLSRYLTEDLSVFGKLLVLIVWLLGILLPWIFRIDLRVLSFFT